MSPSLAVLIVLLVFGRAGHDQPVLVANFPLRSLRMAVAHSHLLADIATLELRSLKLTLPRPP